MGFKTGTSTNYIDLLNDLIEFAITEEASTATIGAGGTGYTVGDDLTIVGGTFGTAAVFNVDTVSGGVVTAVSVITDSEGDYTATPSNPAATTGGTGSGCTLNVTYVPKYGWVLKRESQEAVSATIAAGGTGYTVGDDLTLVGGTKDSTYGADAVFNVDTVSGGVVTAVSVIAGSEGNYLVIPGNPVSTTGGTGSGCTLTVTWQGATASDKEAILEGNGSGSDSILVGVRTYNISSAYNWELAGFTGYDGGLEFQNQAGISPGRWTAAGDAQEGAYVPLNNASMTYWFYVDSRRIIVKMKVGTTYPDCHLGWLDRFATAGEYPYPLFIEGCSSDATKVFSDTGIGFSGLADPIGALNDTYGPGFVRSPGGQWRTVRNGFQTALSRTATDDLVVYPAGSPDTTVAPAEDRPFNVNKSWDIIIPSLGNPGIQSAKLEQTVDSPNYVSYLVPATLIGATPDILVFGEIRGVFWISADAETATIVAEDTITVGSDTYTVFQNCNRSNPWAFLCIKQE